MRAIIVRCWLCSKKRTCQWHWLPGGGTNTCPRCGRDDTREVIGRSGSVRHPSSTGPQSA